ncbi:hypothetical protein HUN08_16230 [Gordonia sp. X0973]|uniref:hypothetical protein n=1 Tax=Gordonia sp. X0973 TaxID=2742602 RepID=UPI000F527A25|nr:hypothetical protein [Gordonia sp. X0973]QKT08574.1 hypothetical protein HUN08_16230 [Gordonia sp. X0973]
MTTIAYFLISAVALAGAALLLWLDRQRASVTRRAREVWADAHDFAYRESDTKLRRVFRRAGMDVPDHVEVRDVAFGDHDGAEAVVFDLTETATVVAVRRQTASQVIVDLRHEDVLAPAETDVELLGAMGPRVMFSNNIEVARRVCDRRMIALANSAPPFVEILWTEGRWALGSMPLTDDPNRLDAALDVVQRFADLLRVLPPSVDPQDAPDPRDPSGPANAELADEKTDHMRDKRRREAAERAAGLETTHNPLPPRGPQPGYGQQPPAPARRPAPPQQGQPGQPQPGPQWQQPPRTGQPGWQRPRPERSPLQPGDDQL